MSKDLKKEEQELKDQIEFLEDMIASFKDIEEGRIEEFKFETINNKKKAKN
jgi:hypothetical protein